MESTTCSLDGSPGRSEEDNNVRLLSGFQKNSYKENANMLVNLYSQYTNRVIGLVEVRGL